MLNAKKRSGVPRYAIVVTDGKSNNEAATIKAAKKLRSDKVIDTTNITLFFNE